jgi:hypothetical protein
MALTVTIHARHRLHNLAEGRLEKLFLAFDDGVIQSDRYHEITPSLDRRR